MDVRVRRVTYYTQKITEYMNKAFSKQKWRYPRLRKYKKIMSHE